MVTLDGVEASQPPSGKPYRGPVDQPVGLLLAVYDNAIALPALLGCPVNRKVASGKKGYKQPLLYCSWDSRCWSPPERRGQAQPRPRPEQLVFPPQLSKGPKQGELQEE